ncbi:hypothetical protein Dda_3932 [Drechslerella dactyloides]|uniref:Uncharacterized protein n=1 Tax=Drechslerella dactyloides TaxID=74499 RepID=A0AAD6NJZ5_DREDA|nr:hypothetical protein Dda_3932 [Drechslerella dactyloides]
MKGLLQTSLAAAALTVVAATPMAQPLRYRHLDHHHLEKRAVEIVTVTQQVVEIEYVYSTVYVDPAMLQDQQTSSAPEVVEVVRPSTTPSPPAPKPTPKTTTPAALRVASPSTTRIPTTTPSSVYVPPPPSSSSSVEEESTTPSAVPTLPTQVIPVFVPPSSSSTTTTSAYTPPYTPPVVHTPSPSPSPSPSPTTTTTPYVAPQLVASTSAAALAAVSTSPATGGGSSGGSGGGSGGGEMFYGEGTYYDCGLGSCGNTNTNADYVVAMSKLRMAPLDGGNPNSNPMCGQKVRVYSDMAPDGVVFTVQDKCPGCVSFRSLPPILRLRYILTCIHLNSPAKTTLTSAPVLSYPNWELRLRAASRFGGTSSSEPDNRPFLLETR